MKRISKLFLAFFTAILLLVGCLATGSDEDKPSTTTSKKAEVSFSMKSSQIESNILFSEGDSPEIKYLMIEAAGEDGEKVFDGENIELNEINGSYFTKTFELATGTYYISRYVILDANGSAIYGIPAEGTSYAVEKPLVYDFEVNKGESNLINPQVVAIDESADPADFGLTAFTFTVVTDLSFYVNARISNEATHMEEYTSATVTVENIDTEYSISGDNNKIIFNPNDAETLLITISKDGYVNYSHSYTIAELKAFDGENPLNVTLTKKENNIPTDGLVAYYPFNGNANDESGNGNDGTVYGATLAKDRLGNENSAYSFDGDDYINVGNIIDTFYEFSFSVWININNRNVYNPQYFGIFGQQHGTYLEYESEFNFYVGNPKTRSFGSVFYWKSLNHLDSRISYEVSLSEWHLISQTYDGEIVKQYDDGVLINKTTASNESLGNEKDFIIGKVVAYPMELTSCYFNGFIDDIRIYDRALSQEEITALYEEGE